ncbi:hypothetical protein GCM10027614_00140 [Micromonospora vulcania]
MPGPLEQEGSLREQDRSDLGRRVGLGLVEELEPEVHPPRSDSAQARLNRIRARSSVSAGRPVTSRSPALSWRTARAGRPPSLDARASSYRRVAASASPLVTGCPVTGRRTG